MIGLPRWPKPGRAARHNPRSGHRANPVGCAITKRQLVKTCGRRATSKKVALSGTSWHYFRGGGAGEGLLTRFPRVFGAFRCETELCSDRATLQVHFVTLDDEHLPRPRRPHRSRPRNPGVPCNAPSKQICGRQLRPGWEARVEHSGGKIPTLRVIRRSNLQLATGSARTTARAPKTSSRRHGLTGIGLRCDDTFSPRADLQLNPLACRELRVTTLVGRKITLTTGRSPWISLTSPAGATR
jgi:hypothetical protein